MRAFIGLLRYGVMAAPGILVPLVSVRIWIPQHGISKQKEKVEELTLRSTNFKG